MKQRILAVLAGVFITIGLAAAGSAQAATPTLSLSLAGGDSVQVNVFGDPNSAVSFYYNVASAAGMQVRTLGNTSSSGSFSESISTSGYGIDSGDSVYVIVNNQQSPLESWPYTSPSGSPTLSQSSVTVGLGQSTTVVSEGNTAPIYMTANTNSSVATVQTNGTQQVTVTGEQIGSTSVTLCYVGTTSNCTNLNVNVQSSSVQSLSLSQSNVTLSQGQSLSVSVSGGNGVYNITGNTNSSAVSVALNGNSINLDGIGSGSSNITVCDQSGDCATLFVTVGTTSGGSITFSPTNPSISVGQSTTVDIFGGSGYYITSNSNSAIASESLNGSALTISGLESGATTLTVCSAANGCGSLYITVGSSGSGLYVSFGTTNPIISTGQSATISLSGAESYSVSSNSNASVVQASVNGSALLLDGLSAGTSSITVCASSGGCNSLTVTVQGTTTVTTSSNSTLVAEIAAMQSQLASIVSAIQTMETSLSQLAASAGTTVTTSGTGTTVTSSGYQFANFMGVGSTGTDVTELQQILTAKGFFSGTITGYYGTETEAAVERYQAAHGIAQLGYVGPSTRTALNAGE